MLNEFLLAAYKDTQTKLATRQLVDKLKAFDLDDLVALANGDPTAKLAYCDGPSCDGPQSWLDKYKGSPLFEKAVALEKALLEADAASDAKRTEERESDRVVDDQRDALRMQKRMLDLDLALEQEGGAAAAASPEPAVPAAPAAPEVPPVAEQAPPVAVKAAAVGTFLPEARSTRDTVHPESRQGAGALGDYSVDPSETVTEGLQVNKTAAVRVAAADAAGRLFAKTAAASDPNAFYEEVIKKYPQFAGKKKVAAEDFTDSEQLRMALANHLHQAKVEEAYPKLTRLRNAATVGGTRALKGGLLGGLAGAGLAARSGGNFDPVIPLTGAALGGLSGLLAGGVTGALMRPGKAERQKAEPLRSVLDEYHATAAPTKQAGIAGSLLQGVKTLGTGAKTLATSAHAAGGMPQVAKSFGNVAKNFAQKNPLAATGIAAGAAGLGGMALGRATAPNH